MGRPDKLTPERAERILEALKAGNYIETACSYAGIGPATFYRWMERGITEGEDPKYAEFREAVETARAEAEIRNVALIQRSATGGTWQAAAWWLERSFPNRWGRKERHEVTGADGGPLSVAIDPEALESKVAALLEARSKNDPDSVVQ